MSSTIERKLAAIMFTDIVGYSKICGNDESTALSILDNQESLIKPLVSKHKGNIITTTGDGYLIEFSSSVEAVECAIGMQASIKEYNKKEEKLKFHIRIGIHLGDVAVIGDNILGEGVNIAARIEPMASPDGICMTEVVYQSVKSKLDISPERISEVDLKNIDDKHTLYKIPNVSVEDISNNESMGDFQVSIKDIIKQPINKKHFLRNFFIMFIGYELIFSLAPESIAFIRGMIYDNYEYTAPYFKSTGVVNWWEIFFSAMAAVCLLIATFLYTKRVAKIIFNDIRNVSMISNILIQQLGYKCIGKKKDKIKFYIDKRELVPSIFRFKYLKKLEEIANTLYLKFNGNTIIIEAKNHDIYEFLKKIKKLSK